MTQKPSHRCSRHPGSHVRPYRTDGPLGRAVYLQCLPRDGEPHLLDPPGAPRAGLTLRAREAEVSPLPSYAGDVSLPFGLTQTELTVLQAAACGLTVPETARQLHKGAETVKTQRNKIILKIGARNMTHAVCIAAERGIVSASATAAVAA
jgi:DNA-binding CsgD family transcriptional regulator